MELQLETLNSVYDYLPNLYKGIVEIGNLFAGGNHAEGYYQLQLALEGLRWVTEALSLTKEAQKEEIDVSPLAEIVKQLIEGIENNDPIAIWDLLEYETLPLLEAWDLSIEKSIQPDKKEV
mgnify:CR=1 FL=1